MALTVEQLKVYLRADGTGSDSDLTALLAAANALVKRSTGKTQIVVNDVTLDIGTDELYNTALRLLCAHWFENRGVESPARIASFSFSVQHILDHISQCGDYL